ncbi:MAG: hypothetical protein JW934_22225 [Anaerolineae bacterium]|nr:hypothetical protein [Anaerolineae bacterium]
MGKLYLVERAACADDLPLRAARTLGQSPTVVAINLPAARALLDECGIATPSVSLPDVQGLLDLLSGGDVAWLDRTLDRPHALLAQLIAQPLAASVDVVPLPGPVDAVTALILSGLPADRFAFYPYIPADLAPCAQERHTLLFAVDPAGWPAAKLSLLAALGDRRAALFSLDLTWRGLVAQSPECLSAEAILAIEGASESPTWSEVEVRRAVQQALDGGTSPRDAAQEVAQRSGWPRRKVYTIAAGMRENF